MEFIKSADMDNRVLKILGGVALAGLAVWVCVKNIKVGVKSYRLQRIENGIAALSVDVEVKNPLLFGVKINGIQGAVYADGRQIGYVNMAYNYYLAGGKTHVIPVVVNVQLKDATGALITNLAQGDLDDMLVSFDGKVVIGDWKVKIPVQLNFVWGELIS